MRQREEDRQQRLHTCNSMAASREAWGKKLKYMRKKRMCCELTDPSVHLTCNRNEMHSKRAPKKTHTQRQKGQHTPTSQNSGNHPPMSGFVPLPAVYDLHSRPSHRDPRVRSKACGGHHALTTRQQSAMSTDVDRH